MTDNGKRRRAVWWLWFARGLGYGALVVAMLGLVFVFTDPGFLVVGLAMGVVALGIGLSAARRMKKLGEQEGEREGDLARAGAGFSLGCGTLVAVTALLIFAIPSDLWHRESHSAEKAVCLSNIKNLALALQMYLADNADSFPPAEAWCDALDEYVKNWDVLKCPSVKERPPGRACDYAYNRALPGASMSDLADPLTTVAIFESDLGWDGVGDASNLPAAPRHLGGDNYAFCDGHAAWASREKLSRGETDIHWSREGEE